QLVAEFLFVPAQVNPAHEVLALTQGVWQSGGTSFIDVQARGLLHVFKTGKVGRPKSMSCEERNRTRAAAHRNEDRRIWLRVRTRDHAHPPATAVGSDFPRRARGRGAFPRRITP